MFQIIGRKGLLDVHHEISTAPNVAAAVANAAPRIRAAGGDNILARDAEGLEIGVFPTRPRT